MSELAKRIGRRVRAIREERGWSQEKLAEHAGLHRTYIGPIERATHNVSLRKLEGVAGAFGITVSELLNVGGATKDREEAEATLFALLRSFETKELRFIVLLLKVLLRWKTVPCSRAQQS